MFFLSHPCNVPECFKKYFEFFEKNGINFCISGGYAVYRAGFCHSYNDVDIFVDDDQFDEESFLELDHGIHEIPCDEYINVNHFLKKRLGTTVTDSNGKENKIDFVLIACGQKIRNNYLFSEHVTSQFDIDICRVSIISVDEEYRLIFNKNFKVFIKNQTEQFTNKIDSEKMSMKTQNRLLKYEQRLKPVYRIFSTNCAPPFSLGDLMDFQRVTMEK